MTPMYPVELSKYKGQLMFDRVTKTLDKEVFEYLLDKEVKKAVRYLYFFSLVVLQSDKIPEDLRQDEEEELLRRFAGLIREEIRNTDAIGRIGHDKFFIILDQADLQASSRVGDRIRERISHYAFRVDGHEVMLSGNIGVACFPTHANDLGTLIQRAEFALIQSKKNGGGKVYLPE